MLSFSCVLEGDVEFLLCFQNLSSVLKRSPQSTCKEAKKNKLRNLNGSKQVYENKFSRFIMAK